MIILDTDIAIDIFRRFPPAVAWLAATRDRICLPGVVAMELYQGCHNKSQLRKVRGELARFAILWPSESESDAALANFSGVHLSHALGLLDALIAATALTHAEPLHTFNQKHFAAVPQLKTIQPYPR